MKRFLLIAAGGLIVISGIGFCQSVKAQPVIVERTPQESDTLVILLGRGCRSATDQDWLTVCGAAVVQAQKELEARKPKPKADAGDSEKPK